MSKTDDTSKLGPATQVRALRDDELQEVSGGVKLENVQITNVVAGSGRTGKVGYMVDVIWQG